MCMSHYIAQCRYLNEVHEYHLWRDLDDRRVQCARCKKINGKPKRRAVMRSPRLRPIPALSIFRRLKKYSPVVRGPLPGDTLDIQIANMLYHLRYGRRWTSKTIAWKIDVPEERLVKFVYKYDWFPTKGGV